MTYPSPTPGARAIDAERGIFLELSLPLLDPRNLGLDLPALPLELGLLPPEHPDALLDGRDRQRDGRRGRDCFLDAFVLALLEEVAHREGSWSEGSALVSAEGAAGGTDWVGRSG